jgi:hypothetical protein
MYKTRICKSCGQSLLLTKEFFHVNGIGFRKECKSCINSKNRLINSNKSVEDLLKDKEKRYLVYNKKELNSIKVMNSRRKKKDLLIEYKGGKCEKCGIESEISDIYDFHHKDPTQKEFGLSGNYGKNLSLDLCKKEVDKCLLLCKNCHAITHYEINQARMLERINKIS